MNKLIVSNLVTLDGFIAGPNGELDWFRADDEFLEGDIAIFGSGELVSRLLPHGLIDELRLFVHPILLGRGRPEFSGLTSDVELNFASARPFESGIVQLVYEVRT